MEKLNGDNKGNSERALSRARRRRDGGRLEWCLVPDNQAALCALPLRGIHDQAFLRRHTFQDWLQSGRSGCAKQPGQTGNEGLGRGNSSAAVQQFPVPPPHQKTHCKRRAAEKWQTTREGDTGNIANHIVSRGGGTGIRECVSVTNWVDPIHPRNPTPSRERHSGWHSVERP
jgi:hypothetical protein